MAALLGATLAFAGAAAFLATGLVVFLGAAFAGAAFLGATFLAAVLTAVLTADFLAGAFTATAFFTALTGLAAALGLALVFSFFVTTF